VKGYSGAIATMSLGFVLFPISGVYGRDSALIFKHTCIHCVELSNITFGAVGCCCSS